MVSPVANFYSAHRALLAGIAAAFFVASWILLAVLSPIVVASLPAPRKVEHGKGHTI